MTTASDKVFWSRIEVTWKEYKTTISDIPLFSHHIMKMPPIYLSVSQDSSLKQIQTLPDVTHFGSLSISLGTEARIPSLFLIIFTAERAYLPIVIVNWHSRVIIPVIIMIEILSKLMRPMICFWYRQFFYVTEWRSKTSIWLKWSFSAYTLPYRQCLYSASVSGSAYIPGWFPNFQLLPSFAYSVSRDIFILFNLHHMPCYLWDVTCHVSCENWKLWH